MTTHTRRNWWQAAACRGTDTEAFFPEDGQGGRTAQRICASCPVAQWCIVDAIGEEFGTFGGTVPKSREALRKNFCDSRGDQNFFNDRLRRPVQAAAFAVLDGEMTEDQAALRYDVSLVGLLLLLQDHTAPHIVKYVATVDQHVYDRAHGAR